MIGRGGTVIAIRGRVTHAPAASGSLQEEDRDEIEMKNKGNDDKIIYFDKTWIAYE